MLTRRGWWLLTVSGLAAILGLLVAADASTTVPILGLTLLAWFIANWITFAACYRSVASRIEVTRTILQGGREVSTTWARVPCKVRLELKTRGLFASPLCFAEDRLPIGYTPTAGSNAYAGDLSPGNPAIIEYDLKPPAPGMIRFEGVALRVTDLCGLFYRRTFIRSRVEYLVLPPLADDEGKQRADKRFNMLPPPGIHRLRRPGGGSELLDLRDYRPGDPPKMIAWKASARRDRLITKEYESDVPVRCVLYLDTSQSVRAGPPGATPVCRLSEIAAAVAQAAAGNRDLVGLTTFDDHAATGITPARTHSHIIRLLGRLAESAALLPDRVPGSPETLLRTTHSLAQELYPDLLEEDLNERPLGMYWLPLLDSRWGWLIFIPLLAAPVLAVQGVWFEGAVEFASAVRPRTGYLPLDAAFFLFALSAALFLPSVLAILFWLLYGIRGFLDPRRTLTRKRKQLGAIFAARDADSPGAVERYLRDDDAFTERAGRFLTEHHVRVLPPAYGEQPARDRETKVAVLAAALLRSVLAARDNELYVIFADLVEIGDACELLVRAVRLARAKHHHVLIVVPWPDGVPVPIEPGRRARPVAKPLSAGKRGRLRVAQLVQTGLVRLYQRRFVALRTELTRVGATVLRVSDDDPIRAVLDRLDRLRGVRTRR